MTIALAGRRIDSPDAQSTCFPLVNIEAVRSRLRRMFIERSPQAIVSSAACGADLLGLQQADALGIRFRIVLPFEPAQFRDSSVVDRPGDWGPIFDDLIQKAAASGNLVVLASESGNNEPYLATNLAVLDAAAEVARESDGNVMAILVWDQRPRDGEDVSHAFAEEATRRGIPLVHINTM
jgi:hypothetical protein